MMRQPIVSVVGHVDHGKTAILDCIRGTSIVEKEAGRITQHIGATEVPIHTIYRLCSNLTKKKFKIPGLLFIDTPGHHAFTTLRARGGALADLAVLVVDINEGFKPQTIESLNILRQYKTPFVLAANKIDLIHGWVSRPEPFVFSLKRQTVRAKQALDERIYELVDVLYKRTFVAERYDRVSDFAKSIAILPTSGKTKEGIPDLLMVLMGLAQRYLDAQLRTETGAGEGTVLEVKEEKGLGTTIDVILYNGQLSKNAQIVIGAKTPVVTHIKALLKPKPLEEIRISATSKFKSVDVVNAAAGVKISAKNLDTVIAGAPLKVVKDDLDAVTARVQAEMKIAVETQDSGVLVKADTIGSLEALAFELKAKDIGIKKAEIGDISRKDVVEVSTVADELKRVILGFNVGLLEDAAAELKASQVASFTGDVIYKLLEDYEEWAAKKREELDVMKREEMTYPGKIKILEGYVFRLSKPAIVGVRVLGGRVKPTQGMLRADGRNVGRIKSIRTKDTSLKEARQGEEVAIAIEGCVVGRHIKENDILYVDVNKRDVKKLMELDLTLDEKEILEDVIKIKRKEDAFWGM